MASLEKNALAAFFLLVSIVTGSVALTSSVSIHSGVNSHSLLAALDGAGSGLVGWWKFDEGSGTTATDSSGNNNTGTLMPTATPPVWSNGQLGQALSFNGTSSYVNLGAPSSLNMSTSNAFTVSAWVNPLAVKSSVIFGRGGLYDSGAAFEVYNLGEYLSNGRWTAQVSDGINTVDILSDIGSMAFNQWQHMVLVWDGPNKTLTLYKNGSNIKSATNPSFTTLWDGGAGTRERNTGIGYGARDTNGFFNGSIDDVRIYNRALSVSEITDLYNYTGGAPPPPTNQAPTVSAGSNQTITLPATATLSGTASDDGLPTGSTLTTAWSVVSGGSVTFSNPSSLNTTATFSTAGTYVLQLSASDSALTSTSNVTITVNPAPSQDTQAPTVPTNLTSTVVSSSQINLSWTVSTDNVVVTGYNIYRNGTQVGTSAINSYSDSGLSASTAYTYTVSAYDAVPNTSAQSSSASATTLSQTSTNTCSQVSQYGITWTFDKSYTCGQFVNGDWWVVGPVTINSVSPGWDGEKNGSMIDPVPNTYNQGYDARLSNYHYQYSDSLRISFPVTIQPTKSLISVKGLSTYDTSVSKSSIDSAAVLTIVDNPVPANSFRPAYVFGSKTIYNTAQVNYGSLPSLPVPANIPNLTDKMKMPWLDYGGKTFGEENMFPVSDVGSAYPPSRTRVVSQASLEILLDIPNKKDLVNRLIQLGIDDYSVAVQNDFSWVAAGGYGTGHKWEILFAGIMLNNSQMKSLPEFTNTYPLAHKFAEEGWTYYNSDGKAMFGSEEVLAGLTTWGGCTSNCMARDPNGILYPEQMPNGGGYRQIVSPTFVGEALVMTVLDSATSAKELFNHSAFFDYVDNWTVDPLSWTNNSSDYYRDYYGFGGDGNGFMTYMWNTYRNGIPSNISYTVTITKSGTGSGSITSNVGSVNCGSACVSSTLNSGTSVTLTAAPDSSSVFGGWGGGSCSGTSPTCTFTLSSNTTVTATFNTTGGQTYQSADLNQNGRVNAQDFSILLSYWGNTTKPPADINQNGVVNAQDFSIMLSQWTG